MAQDISTLVQLHSEATGKAYAVLQVIADQCDSLGKAEILKKLLAERTRLSASTVHRAIQWLVSIGELRFIDQHSQQRGNLYQIQIRALLAKPRRQTLTPLVMTSELSVALEAQEDLALLSSCQPDTSLMSG